MIKTLKVILWGEEVGRLVWDDGRKMSYFTYHPAFVKKGIDVSPLWASIHKNRGLMPVWGEEQRLYQKLPAFLADSLPDAWGNQLFDLWRQKNHLSHTEITPLDKLSFIGKRGMGALEFIPEYERNKKSEKIDVKSLVTLAERIFTEREEAKILPEESITMQSLLAVGTSAGGRQPKAIIAINPKDGEIRSGQISNLDGYDYYLLKFGNSEINSAELEMTYYELAVNAGINMMHSEFLIVDGCRHFMTKRFDRVRGKKHHTQTLAAMCPEANSYEQLISVCRKLHLPEADSVEIYRRMIFNLLSNNTDDHNKNFSFIMDERGNWRLAPAYDITYILNLGGIQPNQDHCMFIRAKLRNVTKEDVLQFAFDNGIRKPEKIIKEVRDSLLQFRKIASKNAVDEKWIGRVESTIMSHLRDWNECDKFDDSLENEIEGHKVSNIRIEQAYRGNFHLYANIDGKDKKFVIGKNKEEYPLIGRIGIVNLTEEILLDMVKKYLCKQK